MSVSKKLVNRVLKKVFAADSLTNDQIGPEAEGEQPPLKQTPGQQPGGLKIVSRIYFFSRQYEKEIEFDRLFTILSDTNVDKETKKNLYDKLADRSFSGPYFADYFKWVGVAVLLQDLSDEAKKAAYYYNVSPWGTLQSGTNKMKSSGQPDFAPPRPEDIATDRNYGLFGVVQDSRGQINDMVLLATTGSSSIFANMQNVPDNICDRLLLEKPESLVTDTHPVGDFTPKGDIYSRYRLSYQGQGLRNIDGTTSNRDEIGPNQFGYYAGGDAAFKDLMKATGYNPAPPQEEKPQEPGAPQQSLKDQEDAQESRFKPVDEQNKTTKKEEELRTTQASSEVISYIKEIEKKDDKAKHYTGDNSVMQDFSRLPQKIRKEAAEEKGESIDISLPATSEAIRKGMEVLKKMNNPIKNLENKVGDSKETDIRISVVQKVAGEDQEKDAQITSEQAKKMGEAYKNFGDELEKLENVTGKSIYNKSTMASARRVVAHYLGI